ncbi:MAG: PIN domain-containing protein [Actinomycetota bacterium]|nr:PIN domain-containing protein [Actinomycetota bacterium]
MAAALTCDTSVIIAGLSRWHPSNDAARAWFPRIGWLPAHVLAESVSVLSRLPNGRAVSLIDAVGLIRQLAEGRVRQLRGDRYLLIFGAVGSAGMGGGAVYDAIIGATAREHDATLLTLDRKAVRTYSAVGAAFQLLH